MERNPRSGAAGSRQLVTPGDGNATSSSGAQVTATQNQQAGIFAASIPANSTVPISFQGSFFYMQACSAAVSIKAGGGSYASYAPGTGYKMPKIPDPKNPGNEVQSSFALLQVKNDNAFPVVFSLYLGFGEYIDNRLILQQGTVFPVMKVTYSGTPATPGPIAIADVSGQPFFDQNGKEWLALSRTLFYIDNLSLVSNLLLLNSASATTGTDGNCGTVFPGTTRTFPFSGDFSVQQGGGNIAACIIEMYNAIAPSF